MTLRTISSLLIANRGEIAVRVIRTAREMGVRTIAVYSELDRDALHATLADEAWNIGAAPAAESYLDMDKVLEVAAASGADAVHPGYGFLSENATFARRVLEAGLIWVGPPPEAIEVMGNKIASRSAVEAVGVRAVPGTIEPLTSADEVAEIAERYGYPVAIKAAHGGGGKGLRVVRAPEEVEDAFEGARREADAYFGNAEVYVEKYLERPRHVEAQILCDDHGGAIFLGERDCSVQRRHQKLVEETPSPGLDPTTRAALGEAAIAVARACDYRNAGTVEFLLDADGSFYFLEMNTRLQVEHTVTEMVTGVDLVREQLRVAAGEPISIPDVTPSGHAIELRINAEDPANNFLPSPGTIVEYREPAGYGVRVDSWVEAGTTVSQYYDNLIAKLVVWAPDRQQAIARARRAVDEYHISGIATTLPAHRVVLNHPDFVAGRHYTKWMEDAVDLGPISHMPGAAMPEDEALAERSMTVEVGGRRFAVRFWAPAPVTPGPGASRRRPPAKGGSGKGGSGGDDGIITAPMQGTIVKVSIAAGDRVSAGQALLVLEAMKMETEVATAVAGEVVELRVQAGDTVAPGEVLAIVR